MSMMKQTRLIMEILSRLPVKTLLRFKSASKSFLKLIISPEFVKLHSRRSLIRNPNTILLHSSEAFLASFDFNRLQCPPVQLDIHPDIKFNYPATVIGTCNGVVCYYSNNREYVLYNPATRYYKKVPGLVIGRLVSNRSAFFQEEFAYDCISNDFKIFNFIIYFDETCQPADSETFVYKSKDNLWSTIKSRPPPYYHSLISCSRRIANNSLYWKTYNYDSKNTLVIRFDISSHGYEEISLPIRVADHRNISLGVLKGRLHMMEYGFGVNIWMLNADNCWTRVFCCSDWEYKGFCPSLYAYSKDGRKIIIGHLQKFKKVICCDLESQTISVVQVVGLPEGDYFTATPWAESLVPLR